MPKYAPANGGVPILSTYIGGTAAACGTTATAIPAATGSNWAIISAEGANAYFVVNGTAATTSPGYVAADSQTFIPPIDNLGTVSVIGAGTAAVVHVAFYQN